MIQKGQILGSNSTESQSILNMQWILIQVCVRSLSNDVNIDTPSDDESMMMAQMKIIN